MGRPAEPGKGIRSKVPGCGTSADCSLKFGMKLRNAVLLFGKSGHMEASVSDDWLTDVLHRVDQRCARQDAEREPLAGRYAGVYWLLFWLVAVGVPVGLWHYSADFTGLIGSLWQILAGSPAG